MRALLSVWDKAGVTDFARGLAGLGFELISTGGTAAALRAAGLAVREVSDLTGFPEILDGRVKTLHPKIYAGLLFRRADPRHREQVRELDCAPIDLVCVNLYPFERVAAQAGAARQEIVENIDVGGPALLRAAAKNHADVVVVCDPADYLQVLDALRAGNGQVGPELRLELAQKAFARTALYDAAIARHLAGWSGDKAEVPLVISAQPAIPLRYGENPHQAGRLHLDPVIDEACIADAELLHGKEMSYNNYLDGDAAVESVRELVGSPGVAIVKHSNPCGFAMGDTLAAAFEAAWQGDPVSAFGSVIAVTVPVDLATACLMKGRFVEALIAPDFLPDALEFLKAKSKDIRLLKLRCPFLPARSRDEIRPIHGGWLVQDRDLTLMEQWISPTAAVFPEGKKALAEFGVKACKHIKSNAIAIVREYKPSCFALLGMGAGQPNRVDSVKRLALAKARENIEALYKTEYGVTPVEFAARLLGESVLVSDAFFPFADNIEGAAQAGIRYIVQPGGSKRDEEVIAACDKFGIAMAFIGTRHFRH